jgi:hypothetical protein
VLAQRDIRLLQTEIGTRGRLAQLERWNVRVLALSAPTADQILGDKFQLASLSLPSVSPRSKRRSSSRGPRAEEEQPLPPKAQQDRSAPRPAKLLHEASVKTPEREVAPKAIRPRLSELPANEDRIKAPAGAPSRPRVKRRRLQATRKLGTSKPRPATPR